MAGYEEKPAESGVAAVDALLAAIVGEPLPRAARDDAGLVAEHRAAVADVALLRRQLTALGDALAGPVDGVERASVRAPRGRGRRPLTLALGTLAAAAAATVVTGMGWLVVQGGGGTGSADDAKAGSAASRQDSGGKAGDTSADSPEMRVACSRVLAEGTVVSIAPGTGGDVRVVLKVRRYYRPQASVKDRPTLTVTLDGGAREDLKPGVYTLVRIPVRPQDGQDWVVGRGVGEAREELLRALPGAGGLTCRESRRDTG
ncbi:hypothetical protein ACFYP4_06595 [Streptomyces sp. NPDC005551]|uniref:hypothetical protein n=1 Tax=Streptomyces sp. NPDC005551 TaxID=3364725 RepID=UPI0036A5E76C